MTTAPAILAEIPADILDQLRASLGVLAYYRDEIARGRETGARFGGGRRYVDDVRRNLRRSLLGATETLREFVRVAPENGVDP
jgi:hypothetical protein